MKNTPESELILDIVRKAAHLQWKGVHVSRFLELARINEIKPLLFQKLKIHATKVPKNIYAHLKETYHLNIARNLSFWKEYLGILRHFEKSHIRVVPIKGMDILIRFYPEIALRVMADIDILVREEDIEKADRILLGMGYQKQLLGFRQRYWRQNHCHFGYTKGSSIIELHWALDFKRDKANILPELWKRTNTVIIEGQHISLLSSEDAFFAFALHLRRFGNIFSLKQILDTARIIRDTSGFDWSYIARESKKSNLQSTVFFVLSQIDLLTEVTIPKTLLDSIKTALWKKALVRKMITKLSLTISPSLKKNYLLAHFLLYDSVWKALRYALFIPYEQFCNFYDLTPYTKKTDIAYRARIAYIPLKAISSFIRWSLSSARTIAQGIS